MKRILKVVLPIVFGVAVIWAFVFLWKKSGPDPIVYSLEKVTVATITNKAVVIGKINPRNEVNIVPQIAGIVSELLKDPGETVKKNEVIARIRVIPDLSSLNAAETQLENARLSLELATQNFERVKKLYEQATATLEEYQQSMNNYEMARHNLTSAQNNLEIVKNGVTEKYASYSNTNIKSTVDGTILSIPVEVGNSVIQANTFNEGTTIATIADMNDMLFVGNIDETEVGYIRDGMALSVTIGAIKGRTFDACLEYISPQSEEENGAVFFEIKAAMTIPDDIFVRAGYSANAEIILRKAENVPAILESTVKFDDTGAYVEVFSGMDGRRQLFEKRNIELGLSDGIYVEVSGGLDGSELIKGREIQDGEKQ